MTVKGSRPKLRVAALAGLVAGSVGLPGCAGLPTPRWAHADAGPTAEAERACRAETAGDHGGVATGAAFRACVAQKTRPRERED